MKRSPTFSFLSRFNDANQTTIEASAQDLRDANRDVDVDTRFPGFLAGFAGDSTNHSRELLILIQIKIIGSYGARARQDLPQVVKLAETGIFSLQNTVTRKCRFEEANQVYKDLDDGKIVGRAVIEITE
ncbi:hypothetical protein MA16_Dca001297 [Dendrobium catenatum]|uniref:Uncharacterized protein n=1 Tax=Dendrobium catenatum TaxID=906689 RepID=A0A2I0WM05_9ASPA|nr:hypothetical protein MA16_Dca001297 [Dendrobium catenatum]